MGYVLVFIGSGIGGVLRHAVNLVALRWFGAGFPLGTMAINIAGSLLMGLFIGLVMTRSDFGSDMRLLVATGLLGGFTTFSAFSLEAFQLYERGRMGEAALYVLGSVTLSILALALGFIIVRRMI